MGDPVAIAATVVTSCAAGALVGSGHAAAAVIAVIGALGVIWIAAQPVRALLAGAAVLPFMFYGLTVGGFSVFLGLPLILLISVSLLLRAPASTDVQRHLPVGPFVLFAAVAASSAIASTAQLTGWSRVVYLVAFGLLALAVARAIGAGLLSESALATALFLGSALAGAAVALQVLAQFVVSQDQVTSWLLSVTGTFGGVRAIDSAQDTPNWFIPSFGLVRGIFPFMAAPSAGQYLMMGLIAGLWLRRQRVRRVPFARWEDVALAIVALGMLLTFSRQAWVGAVAGIAFLGRERGPIRIVATVAVVALAISLIPAPGSDRSFGDHLLASADTSSPSTSVRLELWGDAVPLILERPLLGVGPGQFVSLSPDPSQTVYYAHNVALDVLVEVGIVGGVAFVAMFASGLRAARRRRAALPFALLVAYLVANMFDDVLYFPRNGIFLALAFALAAAGGTAAAAQRPVGDRAES